MARPLDAEQKKPITMTSTVNGSKVTFEVWSLEAQPKKR